MVGMTKKQRNPCKGCIWAERISEGLIFCPFPQCVKGNAENKMKLGERDRQSREKGVGS